MPSTPAGTRGMRSSAWDVRVHSTSPPRSPPLLTLGPGPLWKPSLHVLGMLTPRVSAHFSSRLIVTRMSFLASHYEVLDQNITVKVMRACPGHAAPRTRSFQLRTHCGQEHLFLLFLCRITNLLTSISFLVSPQQVVAQSYPLHQQNDRRNLLLQDKAPRSPPGPPQHPRLGPGPRAHASRPAAPAGANQARAPGPAQGGVPAAPPAPAAAARRRCVRCPDGRLPPSRWGRWTVWPGRGGAGGGALLCAARQRRRRSTHDVAA
jgi:hypothetical protein